MSRWSDTTWRFNRNLKIHFSENGKLLCMLDKSDTYLFPHLTFNKQEVTCEKCRNILKEILTPNQ